MAAPVTRWERPEGLRTHHSIFYYALAAGVSTLGGLVVINIGHPEGESDLLRAIERDRVP
jgi:hypothetical protein